ncbi:hypothetical protein PVAP13_8KG239100 [Panicum virgatum]|uniref:Uncharacterized protein n=1 Tax=Panicum virgatum TaxID=38727 RepID=A0A8T0PPE9_PANVG|nr:hypothetical protein PVAP13_8KG239100 [Panicum virgatum]
MDRYGVIKRMISLEFPGQKEVSLFQGRGYNKDQFGVIDIDTTRYRSDKEGTTGDVSVITQVQAQAVDEPDDAVFDVDDEDDTYIDDGVVAPVASAVQGQDDDFFI